MILHVDDQVAAGSRLTLSSDFLEICILAQAKCNNCFLLIFFHSLCSYLGQIMTWIPGSKVTGQPVSLLMCHVIENRAPQNLLKQVSGEVTNVLVAICNNAKAKER